jgi:AcrR family transcriptional regulator
MLEAMSRWEPDGVGRLQAAAFELFAEQGFERTTVAEITERAGLSKRSFFNHFADKREVLFGPISEQQREIVVREIAACPDTLSPLEAVVHGLQAAAEALFQPRRDAVTRRHEIIMANPELQERELHKRAALTDAIAEALRAKGVDSGTAVLSAHAGVLVQQTAMQDWMTGMGQSAAEAELRAQAAQRAPAQSGPGEGKAGGRGEDRPLRELLAEALGSLRTVATQTSGLDMAADPKAADLTADQAVDPIEGASRA